MRRVTIVLLILGIAAAGAAVAHSGFLAVTHAVESLGLGGLILLVLLHVPVVGLLGFAWSFSAGDPPLAPVGRFIVGRLLRDALGVQPFAILLGLRALGSDRTTALRGAISAAVDGLSEMAAKVPYVVGSILALLVLAPHSRLIGWVSLALAATAALVAIVILVRKPLGSSLQAIIRTVDQRWPAALPCAGVPRGEQFFAMFDRILQQRRRLGSGFAIHLFCWFLGACETWVVLHLLGIPATLVEALAIDGTVAGLRTFGFMVPAAAGVQEAGYLLACAAFGIHPAAAIAVSLAFRARDVAFGMSVLGVAGAREGRLTILSTLRSIVRRPREEPLPVRAEGQSLSAP